MADKYFNIGKKAPTKPDAWDHIHEHAIGLGGQKFDVSGLDASKNGGYLYKGCPMFVETVSSERYARPVKTAVVVTGGTTSAPRVSKNHLFKVGDFVYVSGDAVTINSIDVSNVDYDVLTLSAACTGATANAYLLQAVAAGASPTLKYTANALLSRTEEILSGGTCSCVFRIDEWVKASLLPYAITSADIAALAPNIIIK